MNFHDMNPPKIKNNRMLKYKAPIYMPDKFCSMIINKVFCQKSRYKCTNVFMIDKKSEAFFQYPLFFP